MKYELQYPITRDEGGERTTLEIKDRIKGADILVLDEVEGTQAQMLRLIARLCRISNKEAEDLDVVDIRALSEIVVKKQAGLPVGDIGEIAPRS